MQWTGLLQIIIQMDQSFANDLSLPQPSLRPAQSPNLLQQQHQNTSSLCISVYVLHIKTISESILYIKKREISPGRFVAQRVRERVLDEEYVVKSNTYIKVAW